MERDVSREATLHAERTVVPPTEEQIRAEVAGRPLTESARRDLDEIARWREMDDRKAAAKAARTKRRVSERVYRRVDLARAEEERRAALEAEEARRAAERQRASEMERAAALESKRRADAEALRRAEKERNKELEAEAERLAAERQRAQDADATPRPWSADPDHMAALNAERHALELKRQELRVADEQEPQPAPPDERSDEKPSRLIDLPLYSWANANEDEDKAPAEHD